MKGANEILMQKTHFVINNYRSTLTLRPSLHSLVIEVPEGADVRDGLLKEKVLMSTIAPKD